jgi:mitogen-activated protein kinase kinase 3
MSNNGKNPRSPSAGKNKKEKPTFAISIGPPPTRQPEKRINLSRSTKVKLLENGQFNEYLIEFDNLEPSDLLGRGQFGTVKKMKHKETGYVFAVKMINDELMESNDRRNSEIMDLEAPLKFGDGCPYLIKFFGAIHAESYIWILTEVMDTSLDRFYLKMFALKIPVSELFISKVTFSVLSALDYMKQLKLMHRDIKPSNILLNGTGEIKVCDFGISGFTTNSVCTTFKGCQRYMPPEKIDPSLTGSGYSIKADVWSLGISLIEIANGEHPFEHAKGFLGLIKSIVSNEPPKLDADKFSLEFRSFTEKCLVKSPDGRLNVTELLKEPFIEKYLEIPNDLELMQRVVDETKKDKIEA